mgnify:CR=1 FL=1
MVARRYLALFKAKLSLGSTFTSYQTHGSGSLTYVTWQWSDYSYTVMWMMQLTWAVRYYFNLVSYISISIRGRSVLLTLPTVETRWFSFQSRNRSKNLRIVSIFCTSWCCFFSCIFTSLHGVVHTSWWRLMWHETYGNCCASRINDGSQLTRNISASHKRDHFPPNRSPRMTKFSGTDRNTPPRNTHAGSCSCLRSSQENRKNNKNCRFGCGISCRGFRTDHGDRAGKTIDVCWNECCWYTRSTRLHLGV